MRIEEPMHVPDLRAVLALNRRLATTEAFVSAIIDFEPKKTLVLLGRDPKYRIYIAHELNSAEMARFQYEFRNRICGLPAFYNHRVTGAEIFIRRDPLACSDPRLGRIVKQLADGSIRRNAAMAFLKKDEKAITKFTARITDAKKHALSCKVCMWQLRATAGLELPIPVAAIVRPLLSPTFASTGQA